jgi:hypothetical protein
MEKKVVVMGPSDVASMRNAHKEAEAAYFQAKVGALEFAVQEMRGTNRGYSAAELSQMTGLTSAEIAVQMGGWCRAGQQAGISRDTVQTSIIHTENKYVRLMPNGEINPDQTITIRRKQVEYQMRPERNARW